jgi:hypothetical protein
MGQSSFVSRFQAFPGFSSSPGAIFQDVAFGTKTYKPALPTLNRIFYFKLNRIFYFETNLFLF